MNVRNMYVCIYVFMYLCMWVINGSLYLFIVHVYLYIYVPSVGISRSLPFIYDSISKMYVSVVCVD